MNLPVQYTPGSGLNSFAEKPDQFLRGEDRPSDYLARCLEIINSQEPEVKAWVTTRVDAARAEAASADQRYAAGKPLSPIDGMPIGIKDVIQTRDMPTKFGSPIFNHHETGFDSASVDALRRAGALIVGKSVTTEFAFVKPGPTRNPFDTNKTPGGSSSGSSAAVGAGMVPVALGNQVVGSIIRPASFCGNYAIKPTLGALHMGEGLGLSQLHLGVHAASLQDMWAVASEIAERAGGDPGFPGLYGPKTLGPKAKPEHLIFLETEGWAKCDDTTRAAFTSYLEQLRDMGVVIVTRSDSKLANDFEVKISDAVRLCREICSFELRWILRQYRETGKLSDELTIWVEMAEKLTLEDYRMALATRAHMRQALAEVAPTTDAFITLSSVGPAPHMDFHADSGEAEYAFLTGDPAFNAATSALGAPAITFPKMAVNGMPLGVQVIGAPHHDWELTNLANWLDTEVPFLSI
tara:strand:- start:1132 stop:2526 length:1395 start_codon:yes stop_codon:yes gene_type:complete